MRRLPLKLALSFEFHNVYFLLKMKADKEKRANKRNMEKSKSLDKKGKGEIEEDHEKGK